MEYKHENVDIVSSKMCRLCQLVACKREFYTNLLVVDTHRFDVILQMDRLTIFYIVIDCQRRSSIFIVQNHPEFELFGGNIQIESLQSRACPTDSVLVYLDVTPTAIPVVLELMKVFDNFSRILPDKVVEFVINLIPIISPTFKALYQMGPTQLEELKNQLDVIEAKNFQTKYFYVGCTSTFNRKTDGVKRSCIDYGGLNQITLNN